MDIRKLSFGGTSAIVTSMGLIVGLNAAALSKSAVFGSLLIVAIADNLTDSLSVHIYQESERMAEKRAFRTTMANFLTRLCVSLTFALILLAVPTPLSVYLSLAWGFFLLAGLTLLVARTRGVQAAPEISKHVCVAILVIAVSKAIGMASLAITGST